MVADLDDYMSYPETTQCGLDGRYFNKVFEGYSGLIRNPIVIDLFAEMSPQKISGGVSISLDMKQTRFNPSVINILRVIIETPNSRHSNVILFDPKSAIVWWIEPFKHEFSDRVRNEIEEYLSRVFRDVKILDLVLDVPDLKTAGCQQSGFCVAYIIKYVYDVIFAKRTFNPIGIKRFASKIESTYTLTSGIPDIEYGHDGNGFLEGFVLGSVL